MMEYCIEPKRSASVLLVLNIRLMVDVCFRMRAETRRGGIHKSLKSITLAS